MFENEIKQLSNFCVKPFVGLNVDPNGTVTQCCEQDKSYFGNLKINDFTTLEELNNCNKFQDVRQSMMQNLQHASCKKCWNLERAGGRSVRQIFNDMYKWQPQTQLRVPSYWDIRSSNICNLKCRMCHPGASDQIAKEQFFENTLQWFDQTLLMQNIKHVKGLNLLGGEPTLEEKNNDLLRQLIKLGQTDIPILVTTNGTTARGSFFDLLSEFSEVKVEFSLDSVQATNEYIRTNSQYNKIIKNILRYKTLKPNWQYTISQTVSIYNLHDYWKLADEIDRLTGIKDIFTGLVEYPEYLNIINLPRHIKQQYVNDNNTDNVNNILEQYVHHHTVFRNMFKFIKYTNNLDLIRGTSFRDINPHMWDSIHKFMHDRWKDYGPMLKGVIFK